MGDFIVGLITRLKWLWLHIKIARVNSRDSSAIYPSQVAINSPMIEI